MHRRDVFEISAGSKGESSRAAVHDQMSERAAESGAAERESISAFIVCMNEQKHIAACIESVSFCDEILVIDSFSTDETVEIASRLGARVLQHAWPGYAPQKQYGLDHCTHEWVINLDADERVSPELRESILKVLREAHERKVRRGSAPEDPAEICGYYMNRVVFYLGRWWRRGGWYPEYRLRFFRRSKVVWGGVEPHERPEISGPTAQIDGELYHYTYENMDAQFARLGKFSSIAALEDFKVGKRSTWGSLIFSPFMRFLKFYLFKKGFREGVAGFIVAVAEGYYTFMKYAKLWELGFNEAQKTEKEERRDEVRS